MKKTLFPLFCAMGFISLSAQAAPTPTTVTTTYPRFEVFTGSFASLDFMSASGSKSGNITSGSIITPPAMTSPLFGTMPRVGVFLTPNIEGVLTFGVSSASRALAAGTTDRLSYHFMFGMIYNLDASSILNSTFVEAKIGLADATNLSTSNASFIATLGVGKRFELVQNIAFAPQIDIKLRAANSGPFADKTLFGVSFIPLQLSLLL